MDEVSLIKIANYQLLHASFYSDIGLFNGKMGCAIFFFHYARYAKDSMYEDFAGCLLDEIQEDIQENTPLVFHNGLVGIGFGLSYLLQSGFVDGDINDVFSELDSKIMEQDPLRMKNYSIEAGLEGIACYVLSRLIVSKKEPFDRSYLNNLRFACQRVGNIQSLEGIQGFLNYTSNAEFSNIFSVVLRKIVLQKRIQKDYLSWQRGLYMLLS